MAAEEFDIQKKYERRKEEERRREKGFFEDKKKVVQILKILANAGTAKPGIPLGPIFGQHQLNLLDFCKEFNRMTLTINSNFTCSVYVIKRLDKTFTIDLRGVVLSSFISGLRFLCNFSKVGLINFLYRIALINFVLVESSLTLFFRQFLYLEKIWQFNYYLKFLRVICGFLRSIHLYLY